MRRLTVFKEIFTKQKTCDYCGRRKQMIIYAVVRPLYKFIDGKMEFASLSIAKKCSECIEGNAEWENEEEL